MELESKHNDENHNEAPLSPVSAMFQGRSIFITGASGFIGRVLLEKLLRCYPGIRRIYILLRTKKNQPPAERLHKQLLNVPIFDKIRSMENGAEMLGKIVVVPGDIGQPRLGISDTDWRTMLEDESLSIVFHSAATIKFDEPLKVSVTLNLIATRTIIDMCKKLPNLISLCHVSTAYVNSDIKDNQTIEEKLYPSRDKPEHLIQLAEIMDENLIQILKSNFIDKRPNTYTYTKALAEHLVARDAADLPVAIVRPSIVVAAWREPLRGWIDNLNGPTGLILAIGKGLLRTLHVSRENKADIVPVDVVANTMIAAAYYAAKVNNKLGHSSALAQLSGQVKAGNGVCGDSLELGNPNGLSSKEREHDAEEAESDLSRRTRTGEEEECETDVVKTKLMNGQQNTQVDAATKFEGGEKALKSHPPIFHCNSGDVNPITWGEMEDTFFPIIRHYPSCQVLRYPFGSFKSNKYHDRVTRFFAHFLPALLIDIYFVCVKREKPQLLPVYSKLHSVTAALAHFTTQNYNFKTNNLKMLRQCLNETDRRNLYMDIEKISWPLFWESYILGARRYVLKEEDHTLPAARRSFQKAYYIEIGFRTLLLALFSVIGLSLTTMSPLRGALQTLHIG